MDWDIVFLGHGSHRGAATDEGLAHAVALTQRWVGPEVRVRLAGFEFTRPSLDEAILALAEDGSRRIVVAPYFLFDGRHISSEIPELLEEVAARVPGLELRYARTLGVDRRLLDVVMERIGKALTGRDEPAAVWEQGGFERDGLGVVFVTRGSRPEFDRGEKRDLLAAMLEQTLGGGTLVHSAQAEYMSPTVEEASAALAERGAKKVVVLPYIFFPGKVLFDNIAPAMEHARLANPDVAFHLAETLGADERMVAVALERAQEAGDATVWHRTFLVTRSDAGVASSHA